jgi:hypothetical protein
MTLLENMIVTQLVKTFPAFDTNRKIIIVLTNVEINNQTYVVRHLHTVTETRVSVSLS